MTGQGRLITGVLVGAGAMYLLDPDCGARRRALLQERAGELGGIRLILGAAGGLTAVKGLRTRGVGGEVLTALGTALLTRAVSNAPPQQLVDLITEGSGASPPTGQAEPEAQGATVPAQDEEATAHPSHRRRTTKSTKRRRTGQ